MDFERFLAEFNPTPYRLMDEAEVRARIEAGPEWVLFTIGKTVVPIFSSPLCHVVQNLFDDLDTARQYFTRLFTGYYRRSFCVFSISDEWFHRRSFKKGSGLAIANLLEELYTDLRELSHSIELFWILGPRKPFSNKAMRKEFAAEMNDFFGERFFDTSVIPKTKRNPYNHRYTPCALQTAVDYFIETTIRSATVEPCYGSYSEANDMTDESCSNSSLTEAQEEMHHGEVGKTDDALNNFLDDFIKDFNNANNEDTDNDSSDATSSFINSVIDDVHSNFNEDAINGFINDVLSDLTDDGSNGFVNDVSNDFISDAMNGFIDDVIEGSIDSSNSDVSNSPISDDSNNYIDLTDDNVAKDVIHDLNNNCIDEFSNKNSAERYYPSSPVITSVTNEYHRVKCIDLTNENEIVYEGYPEYMGLKWCNFNHHNLQML